MKLLLDLEKGTCSIVKERGDKRYTAGYSQPESTLLYHIQQELKRRGYDVIKKRMWKDGHLVDDYQQYVRTRVFTDAEGWAIYNPSWQVFDAGLKFNSLKPGESLLLAVLK